MQILETQETRTCYKCNIIYPLTREYFYPDYTHSKGFQPQCISCKKEANRRFGQQLSNKVIIHKDKIKNYHNFMYSHFKKNHKNIKSSASVFSESDEQITKNGKYIDSMGTIDSKLCEKYNIQLARYFYDNKFRRQPINETHYNGNFKTYMDKGLFANDFSFISFDSYGSVQWCNLEIIQYFRNHLNKNGNLIFLWRNIFKSSRGIDIKKYFKKHWNMENIKNTKDFRENLKKILKVKTVNIIYDSKNGSNAMVLFKVNKW